MEYSVLHDAGWMQLRQTPDGFVYGHMAKQQDGNGVAVLVYKTDDAGQVTHLLGRYERNPAHDDGIALTTITGGIDEGMDAESAVLQELREEAGLDLAKQRGWTLRSLGTCVPSKFLDQKYHLFCLDSTNLVMQEATGDGTDGESDAYCKWELPHVVLQCKCPLTTLIAVRAGLLSRI